MTIILSTIRYFWTLDMKHLLFVLILAISSSAFAETQYVSDKLRITLRTGQGTEFQIIRALESGSKLEILEQSESGYTQVRTEDGTEGWVRSQYLIEEPIAQHKLDRVAALLEKYKTEVTSLKAERKILRKERNELSKTRSTLSEKSSSLESELARLSKVAAKPILLDKENRNLQQENVKIEKDLQMLYQENQVLKDQDNREWFIAGAAVLLGGIFLGLLIPKIRFSKKSSW